MAATWCSTKINRAGHATRRCGKVTLPGLDVCVEHAFELLDAISDEMAAMPDIDSPAYAGLARIESTLLDTIQHAN